MKLADVTILDFGYPPYPKTEQPTRLTTNLLSSIIHSGYFQKELKYFREEYNIPKEGLSVEHLIKTFEPNLYKTMEWVLKYILTYFNLPVSLKFSFYLLIAFTSFIDLNEDDYPDIHYLENPYEIHEATKNAEEDLDTFSAILFGHKVNKKQFLKWIDANWLEISESMETSLPLFIVDKEKFTNIEISDKILALSSQGKSTKEISNELSKEYRNNEDVLDDGWIKNKLARYKKRIAYLDKRYIDLNPPEEE